MTEKQKRVLQGLIDGKRYTDIAKEIGITRQYAYYLAKRAIGHGGDYTNGYYPNIRNYIAENCEDMADFAKQIGVDYLLVQEPLKYGGAFKWPVVVKMIEHTGIDVKTLMVREPNNVQAQA